MPRAAVLAALLALAGPAWASPPLPGSEDYDQLMPYAGWISTQASNHGGLCCSITDCRVVRFRTRGNAYEAFIPQTDDRGFTKFPDAPNAWVRVPSDVIKRETNPTGEAIACWSAHRMDDRGYYCFFLPDLT